MTLSTRRSKRSMLSWALLVAAAALGDYPTTVHGFASLLRTKNQLSSSPANVRHDVAMSLGRRNNNNNHKHRVPLFMAGPLSVSGAASMMLGSTDPLVEAEVFNDLAHVSLDLVTLLGPATLIIRSAAVLGRLFAMAADYIPDHSVVPTELLFQTFMLSVACVSCAKAALPLALASACSHVRLRDGKAYCRIFRDAGMTWSQYRALLVYSLDWVQVEAGTVIDSTEDNTTSTSSSSTTNGGSDYIYWLYDGQVSVTSRNRELYSVTRHATNHRSKSPQPPTAAGLWGESALLQPQQQQQPNKSSSSNNNNNHAFPPTTLKATTSATLVRLHRPKLTQLMDMDPALAETMRNLVFQGMQAKLAAQLTA